MRYLLVGIIVFLVACHPASNDNHSHDEADGHTHENERPSVDYTIWTDQSELFVEFPVLVVGEPSRFAAHFTKMDGHKPIQEGSVTASLIKEKKGIRTTIEAPSSPGIFTPTLQPTEAGIYKLVFDLKTSDYSDRIVLNTVEVYATAEEASKALENQDENGNEIAFLKEQAWKMEFQTARVMEKEIFEIIPTSGVWKTAPTDYQTLVALSNGRVKFSSNNLTEGSAVKKGQVLMTLNSEGLSTDNLNAEIIKAKASYDQAQSEFNRKKELYESKIVPPAEFEQVQQKLQVAKTNYESLSRGYSSGGKKVVVPFNGFVKSIEVTNGGFVNQGDALLTITSHKSSLLEIQVSPSHSAILQDIQDIWYQAIPNEWSSLKEKGGKILSIGKEVDSFRPMISIFAQVNEGVEMPEGSFTEAQLAIGNASKSWVVPEISLLEDYGKYSVIVQLSGESFELRNVTTGKRNGRDVEILQGLSSGEVVVTKGAYQVKMASMSGQAPAHGHVH